ncbi:MAG: hypothetical protein QOE80_202, partial [Actinomycetota bacterium]|nr:hypothetical protein [Actinomycetota bacterium]
CAGGTFADTRRWAEEGEDSHRTKENPHPEESA